MTDSKTSASTAGALLPPQANDVSRGAAFGNHQTAVSLYTGCTSCLQKFGCLSAYIVPTAFLYSCALEKLQAAIL